MLAMLYLVLFTVLAVGFYAATVTNAQITHNEARASRDLLAAESGMDFVRFQMANLNLPYGTTTANLLGRVASALAYRLDTTPNMGGNTVQLTSGVIHLPSATGWIALGGREGARFRASIEQQPGTTRLVVTVRGSTLKSPGSRRIRLSFTPENATYSLAGINGVTMSALAYTDSYDSSVAPYDPATANKNGSIVTNGDILLEDDAVVNGDARPGVSGTLTIGDDADVTGRRSPLNAPISYASVTLPATYTSLGNVNNTGGTQNVSGGVYVIDNLTLGGTAVVNWQGPVTLYIRYSYNVSGSVVINTYENKPANRKIFFLPTCTTASWSGSNVCVGDLYGPDTDFTISGSVQKLGRITARTINNSSSGGMHADESLPNPGGAGNYVPDQGTYTEL
jgi:hypothetical protein